jgi:putative phosphoesterase
LLTLGKNGGFGDMKVALIGDVHGNLPALEAVLEHAHERKVDVVWNVGDFLGYGAFPDEVVRRIREENALSILGNYDTKVLNFRENKEKWRKKKTPEKYLAFKWAYKQLSKSSRKYLSTLPVEMQFKLAGKQILLTHGSPVSDEEYLKPDTLEERLVELAQMVAVDIVVCGHSHIPFTRQAGGVWFINPGSVGRPDDEDARASYAILQFGLEDTHTKHYRLDYDVARAVAAIRKRKLPEAFAQMVLEGRDFDTIETGKKDK